MISLTEMQRQAHGELWRYRQALTTILKGSRFAIRLATWWFYDTAAALDEVVEDS
jgi:hypothetical protein